MKKTIIEVVKDLRKCLLLYGFFFISFFILCFLNRHKLYNIIKEPLNKLKDINAFDIKIDFVYTNIMESFNTDIAISFYFALLFSFPILLFCIYKFYSKSLYKNEKVFLLKVLSLSFLLTYSSVLVFYFFIFPRVIDFFIFDNFNTNITPMLRISDFILTFFRIMLWIIIIFHFPVLFFSLFKFKVIKKDFLSKNRKMAIVIIFIISAIITPPDVVSQIICVVILIAMFEITIFLIKKDCNKKKN